MTIAEYTAMAKEVKDLYEKLHLKKGEELWGYREFTEGLVGDVGDLTKLVMAKSNFRSHTAKDIDDAIKHELVDCLWAVLMISSELGVDLDKEFPDKIKELKTRIEELIKNS